VKIKGGEVVGSNTIKKIYNFEDNKIDSNFKIVENWSIVSEANFGKMLYIDGKHEDNVKLLITDARDITAISFDIKNYNSNIYNYLIMPLTGR